MNRRELFKMLLAVPAAAIGVSVGRKYLTATQALFLEDYSCGNWFYSPQEIPKELESLRECCFPALVNTGEKVIIDSVSKDSMTVRMVSDQLNHELCYGKSLNGYYTPRKKF